MTPFLSCTTALLVLVLSALGAVAQVASPLWRKPNITTSVTDRASLAGAAIDMGVAMLNTAGQFDGDPYYDTAARLYSQMAEFDLATKQTKYQAKLEELFPLAQTENLTKFLIFSLNYALAYGRAAAKAYAAYGTKIFLDYAVQSWWFGRAYTISSGDVSSGTIQSKTFPISKVCGYISMAGGTFWSTDPANPDLNALGTGSFLVLSALLAEATSDQMYLQAASETAEFVRAHLCNVAKLVQDTISARANDSCAVNEVVGPYNSGLMIHGLGILADITSNATTRDLLGDILLATIPNAAWQNPDDLELVQGLGVVYTRNSTTAGLRGYIESYLSVQFNAVTELATSPGTNIYAGSWPGPPSAAFSGINQTIALSALISAMNLGLNDSTTSLQSPTVTPPIPSQTPTPTPSGPTRLAKTTANVGLIVGIVVGGSAAVAACVVLWLICRCRRSRRIAASAASPFSLTPSVAEIQPLTWEAYLVSPPRPSSRSAEKSGEKRPVPPQANANVASRASRRAAPQAQIGNPNSAALPTEELVRLLNERLHNHEWDEEMPPEYPPTEHGTL
ncbi:hypothetical protein B0H13DRAFT_2364952 [Mycena leptocephala]|nr:hypothetical protein B0H13DRAFT_2364952 [Mycena leptocephala]